MMSVFKRLHFILRDAYVTLFRYPNAKLPATEADYDAYWKDRKSVIGSLNNWQRDRLDRALPILKALGARSVLDIGCGTGGILLGLNEKLALERAIGADISASVLRELSLRGIETMRLDIRSASHRQALPEADAVLLFEVLEHVADAEALLALAQRKARRVVLASVPNTGFITHRLRLLLGKAPLQWRLYPGEHLRFWTLRDMRFWLAAQDLEADVSGYRGVPLLNRIFPALFAAGLFIVLSHR